MELGTMITAPLAGMMLADLGAEVIKIEHPQGGDPFRSFRGGQYSPHFVAYNHGKRSMKLTAGTHVHVQRHRPETIGAELHHLHLANIDNAVAWCSAA